MKDDEAIGQVKQEVVCPNCVHQFEVGKFVHPADLDPEPRRLMELGKRAVEAKDWKHEMFERWEALHCKCPDHVEEWMVNEAVQAHASGLASADAKIKELEREYTAGPRKTQEFIERLREIIPMDESSSSAVTDVATHALAQAYKAGMLAQAPSDIRIAELERELEITRALAGAPIPDVAVGSAASTEGLAPRPSGWRVEIMFQRHPIGWAWQLSQNGLIQAKSDANHPALDVQAVKLGIAPLIVALGATVEVVREKHQ